MYFVSLSMFLFVAYAQRGTESLFNTLEEIRSQSQQASDIITSIQETKRLHRLPELLYRIEKIDKKVQQLKEINKNQH